jgi:SAM-dependent methyltransferase
MWMLTEHLRRMLSVVIIVGSCVAGDGSRYRSVALPSIEAAVSEGDLVLSAVGDERGIAAVYNQFIDVARQRDDCEALALVHDDVELIDPNFRVKVLAAVGEVGVGVAGVIGGAGLASMKWWDARHTAGRVFETRGLIDLGVTQADLDVIDGLLMVISPIAFASITFDEVACPHFHGYDVDYCLQARQAGLRVVVRPIEVVHRTVVDVYDRTEFDRATMVVESKWPEFIRPPTRSEAIVESMKRAPDLVRRGAGRARRVVRSARTSKRSASSPSTPVVATAHVDAPTSIRCGVCNEHFAPPARRLAPGGEILTCGSCGSGVTWPLPDRDPASAAIWEEQYGATRLARRHIWFAEARKRIEWLQLHLAEGSMLEVGCGTGEFVRVAEDEGFDAYGIEPSEWAAAQAADLGVRVHRGLVNEWRAENSEFRFDAVAMWHVLEHVPDPCGFMRDAISLLRPGGLVFIEVPNFESTDAARLGVDWDAAQLHDHFHHFTPDSLAGLLDRCGLEIVQLLPMTSRLYGSRAAWQSSRNRALIEGYAWPALDLLRAMARTQPSVTE